MCISIHPSEMTSTKIYAGEAQHKDRYVHVLAYKNQANNLSPGPNAMLLPIPAAEPLTRENAFDTRGYDEFLDDIAQSTKILTLGRSRREMFNDADDIFDVGSYTVVTGRDMRALTLAAATIPKDKRPELNQDVMLAMADLYPGSAFALCCWNGRIAPEPLLWWYIPSNPDVLFAPGLDAHDGKAPTKGKVQTDHLVTFGSTLKPVRRSERDVRYRQPRPADVAALLPTRAVGTHQDEPLPNGDFIMTVADLTGRDGTIQRVYPGGEPMRLGIGWT